MAAVTVRALPWYAPPRLARAVQQVRRYPLVPLALLTFLLVIPAGPRTMKGYHMYKGWAKQLGSFVATADPSVNVQSRMVG